MNPFFPAGINPRIRQERQNRGHFPSDESVIKLLWLAIRDIDDKRARQRAKEKGTPKGTRKAPGKLVDGGVAQGWNQALGALVIAFGARLTNHLN